MPFVGDGGAALGGDAGAGLPDDGWPLMGMPLLSTRAWAVQLTVAPAATESCGVSAVRTGGVPPMNSALRLEPLASEAVTVDQVLAVAVTLMVARPSPVVLTAQEAAASQGRCPLVTV